MKSAKLPHSAGACIAPASIQTHDSNNPPHAGRWSRWGRYAAAAGFWFFLIKGLVWMALFGAALFFGVDVVQAMELTLDAPD